MLLSSAALSLLLAASQVVAQTERVWFRWRTEPDIRPQKFEIKNITRDRSRISPGYYFIAPLTWQQGWGPKIYDSTGLLIWDGNYTSGMIAQQFSVCDYGEQKGQHLCWHEASKLGIDQKVADPSGLLDQNRIFDHTYTQVGLNYSSTGDVDGNPDAHEFHLIGDTFLQIIYPRKLMDLSPWTGPEVGMIQDSCFQEVSVATGEPVYSWCYLDHLPLETHIWVKSDQQTNFSTNFGGYGITFSPWDFYHLNSVDKNSDGDYLLSGRHADQLMLIAGPDSPNGEPGEALWRLGGPSNEFEFEGDWTFSRQHHARFVSVNETQTVITLFDNSWEGESQNPTSSASSGKIISINNQTMTASLMHNYAQPFGELSRSGGSVQLMPNGNVVVGWGFIRQISEFSRDGELLYHVEINNIDGGIQGWGYRNFKHNWVGMPADPPKLLTYSRDCNHTTDAPLVAYVSWNGATEVKNWRFFTSEFSDGPWTEGVTIRKNNFETNAQIAEFYHPYVAVQALNADGQILSSTSTMTFVPGDEALEGCDNTGCFQRQYFSLEEQYSRADLCIRKSQAPLRRGEKFLGFGAVVVLSGLAFVWIARSFMTRIGRRQGEYHYSKVPNF